MTRLGIRKKTALCLFACLSLWLVGAFWFAQQIPTHSVAINEHSADAIVVLTGGSGRLDYGLQLLAQHKAPVLFISGAGADVEVGDILKKVPADERANIDPASITLGHTAENTIGNAEETARWLTGSDYKKILLVTANYHMPRSRLEFSVMLPQVEMVPAPIIPDDFDLSGWWKNEDGRALVFSEYHKYIASMLRHWFVSLTSAP